MSVRYEDLKVEYVQLASLKPYDGNAKRHTSEQVEAVENSIKEFGFRNPTLVWDNEDGDPEIVAGHARAIAARNLGMETVPVIRVDDLSDAQRRALTLVDNQTTMMTGWEPEQLAYELDVLSDDFDMGEFGFDIHREQESEYTDKVKGLIYEPSGMKPDITDMYDTGERDRLRSLVEKLDVDDAERRFLGAACERFTRFRYDRIADYYCTASEGMRKAMEELRLVIVDRGKTMESAAVELVDRLGETYAEV